MLIIACHGLRNWSSQRNRLLGKVLKCNSKIQRFSHMLSQNTHRTSYQVSSRPSSSQDRSIHILGVGNLGIFFAHALAKEQKPPPITLLLHRESLLNDWEKANRQVEITTNGIPDRTGTFDVELIKSGPGETIKNLIIATKTVKTVSALSSIKHRLTSESTILFTQNGMGTVDEVTEQVFPDVETRPKYLTCITSHGVYSQGQFRSVHAGLAHTVIGQTSRIHPAPRFLIDAIVSATVLAAREVTTAELLRLQLEKLVINAMINPLTAIFNCQNGELFSRGPIVKVMHLLLEEASEVILSLPELRDDPATPERFSAQSLEIVVLDVAGKTAKNTSSMLQDVRASRKTEIDYINGYIVKRGGELGIDCRNNEELVRMVKEGSVIGIDQIQDHFPDYRLKRNWIDDVLSIV